MHAHYGDAPVGAGTVGGPDSTMHGVPGCWIRIKHTRSQNCMRLYKNIFFTHCEKGRCSPPLKKIYCQKGLRNYTKSATLSFTHELDPPPL